MSTPFPVIATTLHSASPGPMLSPPPPPIHAHLPPQTRTPLAQPPPAIAPARIPPPNLLDEDSPDAPPAPYSAASPTHPAPSASAASSAHLPPRPPNPELLDLHAHVHARLVSERVSLAQAMALDAERLRAHQRDLLAGLPAVRDESARLQAVRDVCRAVADRLRGAVIDAERTVAELRRKGDPPVDELVCSTSIVHNQLVDLVAEDNAIEDTVYHLHRALNAGRIDLDRFLRTARVLAEEQFMKRALIEKIRAGIPMGASTGAGWS